MHKTRLIGWPEGWQLTCLCGWYVYDLYETLEAAIKRANEHDATVVQPRYQVVLP